MNWERETSTGIFFWGGIFSNWYQHPYEISSLVPGDADDIWIITWRFTDPEFATAFALRWLATSANIST